MAVEEVEVVDFAEQPTVASAPPSRKTPASKRPASKTPASKGPSGKTPASKGPSSKTPNSRKTPGSKKKVAWEEENTTATDAAAEVSLAPNIESEMRVTRSASRSAEKERTVEVEAVEVEAAMSAGKAAATATKTPVSTKIPRSSTRRGAAKTPKSTDAVRAGELRQSVLQSTAKSLGKQYHEMTAAAKDGAEEAVNGAGTDEQEAVGEVPLMVNELYEEEEAAAAAAGTASPTDMDVDVSSAKPTAEAMNSALGSSEAHTGAH